MKHINNTYSESYDCSQTSSLSVSTPTETLCVSQRNRECEETKKPEKGEEAVGVGMGKAFRKTSAGMVGDNVRICQPPFSCWWEGPHPEANVGENGDVLYVP